MTDEAILTRTAHLLEATVMEIELHLRHELGLNNIVPDVRALLRSEKAAGVTEE